MASLIDELLSDGPVVTDGAWGTQLQERGTFSASWMMSRDKDPSTTLRIELCWKESNAFGAAL